MHQIGRIFVSSSASFSILFDDPPNTTDWGGGDKFKRTSDRNESLDVKRRFWELACF